MTPPPAGSPPSAPKQGLGCLAWLAIVAGILVLMLLIAGVLVWQAVSWVKNGAEPAIASYAPLKLSPGEQEDVDRVVVELYTAKDGKKLLEEYVSPVVFNAVVERMMNDEKRKGTAKPDAPLFVRGAFEGDAFGLKLTAPATDPDKHTVIPNQFFNAEVFFDLEIVDGELVKAEIRNARLKGVDAPWAARKWVNHALNKEREKFKKSDESNKLRAFKLFRREGDRLHVILDGSKFE